MTQGVDAGRRRWLGAVASLAGAPLAACRAKADPPGFEGGWVGAGVERGHALRDNAPGGAKSGSWGAPAVQRRVGALVIGAGIAGLGAARAFGQAGIDDCHLLELEDEPGGNSRGHAMGGLACPLGAHYLPVPGASAREVGELLEELGLLRTAHGRAVPDERHLCHSPQERLYLDGAWHDGLLPPVDALPASERATTLADYRRFAALVAAASASGAGSPAYAIPTARAAWTPAHQALDAITFDTWLARERLAAPALRWYLDYCCRDDYGAGSGAVSAWAGLHYFASRHGFHAPGEAPGEAEPVFTWPEGNAWLARRLAAPWAERLHTGRVVLRVEPGRQEVSVDAWDARERRVERWTAARVVIAVPLFIARRFLAAPPAALVDVVNRQRHAPWLVANLAIARPLLQRAGAPPSWDNVVYADAAPSAPRGAALGYVDAMHQATRPYADATVLTAYWALGGDAAAGLAAARTRLLTEPWSDWAAAVLADLSPVHPDLPAKLRRIDLMRYGHAMSIPVPGLRGSAALKALGEAPGRLQFGHADLSASSVFEEALYQGMAAARRAVKG